MVKGEEGEAHVMAGGHVKPPTDQCGARRHGELKHVVLMCSAVNTIDASALESIEEINRRLKDAGVTFSMSEIKGPLWIDGIIWNFFGI
jgi:hypothetical protein